MRIRVISVGKIREPFYQAGIQEYMKRLRPYARIELLSGLEEKAPARPGKNDIERVKSREGQRILQLMAPQEHTVLYDIKGQRLSSIELAQRLQLWLAAGQTRINMVLGGAYGVDEHLNGAVQERISLSDLTFPHQMAVLIVFEQIYRAFKILRQEPYHH